MVVHVYVYVLVALLFALLLMIAAVAYMAKHNQLGQFAEGTSKQPKKPIYGDVTIYDSKGDEVL